MNENGNFIITTVTKNSKGNYTFLIGNPYAMEEYIDIPLVLISQSKLKGHDYENHIVWLAHIDGRNNVRLIYKLGFTLDDALNQSIVKYLRKHQMFADFTGINVDSGYGSDDPFLNAIIDRILTEAPMEEIRALIDEEQKDRVYRNEIWEYQRRKKLDTGKLVFCRFEKSKERSGYRGYLWSMSTFSDILHREGWWNTYSYFRGDRLIDRSTNLDCSQDEQAIWVARIAEVKQDKRGCTNFILEPLTIVASEIAGIQNIPTLACLQDTGLFSVNSKFDLPDQKYNNDKILAEMVKLIPGLKTDNPSWKKKIISLMEEGRLTIDDLNSWATTPTRYEALAECWQIQDDMPMLYPHTAKHIDTRKSELRILQPDLMKKSRDAFVVKILEELFYGWEVNIYCTTGKGMRFDETVDELAELIESWWTEKD